MIKISEKNDYSGENESFDTTQLDTLKKIVQEIVLDSLKDYSEKINEAEIEEAQKLLALKHPLDDLEVCPIWKALPFLEPMKNRIARWFNLNQIPSTDVDNAQVNSI